MPSYQEIDTAVKVLQSKVEFIMKSFSIANPIDPFGKPKSLLQVYYEVVAGIPLDLAVGNESAPTTPVDSVNTALVVE